MLRAIRRRAPLLLALTAWLSLGPSPARGDEPAKATPSLEDLRQMLAEQKRLLEEQGREIAVLRKQVEETSALALAARNELAALKAKPPEPTVPAALVERLAKVEENVQRLPELEEKTVAIEDFAGSIRIPDTDAAMRIGGLVRMTSVHSFDAIGTDDRFVTSSIPVEGSAGATKGDRTTYSARPSRFNFDLRTPTGVGAMRAFIEGDFVGFSGTTNFRLRHAFGYWRGLTMGQTWSTFSDPVAEPNGIDAEGLNAISLFRQAQIRWTRPFRKRLAVSLSLENPSPDISAPDGSLVQGVNQVPDLIFRLRWTPGDQTLGLGPLNLRSLMRGGSHVQFAFLFRQIRGEAQPQETLSAAGFGYHFSGRVRSLWNGDQDRVLFALAGGWGIGRYINDLGTLGGQDAVFDSATNTLEALPVVSGYVGYEHWWGPQVRSTATWGTVYVDNTDSQVGTVLRQTNRATLNLSWSPIRRIDLVAELLWGRRINKDGQNGEARQFQFGTNFRF